MALDRRWRLHLDPDTGRVAGSLGTGRVTYNSPFPCPNGTPGLTGTMRGVVQHTMVGTLEGTIATFNDPDRNASAHFGVGQEGRIHQFGPVGTGWAGWHAYEANREFYGIEFEDHGHPEQPMTEEALIAGGRLIEFLSRFAGFPLWLMTRYTGQGLAYHCQFAPWNWSHHTCPGETRIAQRGALLERARLIRG